MSIRGTRLTRDIRDSSNTSSNSSSSSTRSRRAVVSQAFIANFKKWARTDIKSIKVYSKYDESFDVKDDIKINAFAENSDCLLLVAYVSRGKLRDEVMSYEKDLNDAKLKLDTNSYVVIIRNENNYKVFYRDETKEFKFIPNFKLNKFGETFGRTLTNGEALNEFKSIVDTIWAGTGFGSDQRIAFNVITWILLSHDDIPFKTTDDGRKLSLKQYIELLKEHCEKYGTRDAETAEFEKTDSLLRSIKPIEVIEAFERVVAWKIDKHQHEQSEAQSRAIIKQTVQLRKTIEGLYTKKSERNALMIATSIYDKLYVHNPNLDINKLAFEYENNWNNRTAQTVVAKKGQIYTHHMMKDLIMKIFSSNIEHESVCYDPTCGTGGFTEHFYKYCSAHNINDIIAYGNEIDEDCSNMAWISGLCSDQDVRVFNLNCFDPEIKEELITDGVDFLLMNPPYGMNKVGSKINMPEGFDWSENPLWGRKKITLTEWTFCRYNMDSFLKPGGWFAFVIPVSVVSENKQNIDDKERMLEDCEIWFVIKIREDIFTPQAGKACCLVIGKYVKGLRSSKEKKLWKTKCVDFTDDGGKIKVKKGSVEYDMKELEKLWNERILDDKCLDGMCENADTYELGSIAYETNSEGCKWYEERVLTATDNWIFTKRDDIDLCQQRRGFADFVEERYHALIKSNLAGTDWNIFERDENDNCEWREVKISDVFELCKFKGFNTKILKDGEYPLIMSVSSNNGIQRYVDRYCVDTEELEYRNGIITCPVTGSVGYCFVQQGKFCLSDNVPPNTLIPLKEYWYLTTADLTKITFILTRYFITKYNYSTKLNNTRLMNEVVSLPFNTKTNQIDLSITNRFTCDVESECD